MKLKVDDQGHKLSGKQRVSYEGVRLITQKTNQKSLWKQRLLRHYLFLRIPLLTLPIVSQCRGQGFAVQTKSQFNSYTGSSYTFMWWTTVLHWHPDRSLPSTENLIMCKQSKWYNRTHLSKLQMCFLLGNENAAATTHRRERGTGQYLCGRTRFTQGASRCSSLVGS